MRLSASSHLATAIFCWLPPENDADPRPQRAVIDFDAVEDALDRVRLARRLDQADAAEALDHRQRDIVLAGELEEQRLGLAILRQEADARCSGGAHRAAR